jgi:hypothetical protein
MRFAPTGESFIFVLQKKRIFFCYAKKNKKIRFIPCIKKMWHVSTPRFLKGQRGKKMKINEKKREKILPFFRSSKPIKVY